MREHEKVRHPHGLVPRGEQSAVSAQRRSAGWILCRDASEKNELERLERVRFGATWPSISRLGSELRTRASRREDAGSNFTAAAEHCSPGAKRPVRIIGSKASLYMRSVTKSCLCDVSGQMFHEHKQAQNTSSKIAVVVMVVLMVLMSACSEASCSRCWRRM